MDAPVPDRSSLRRSGGVVAAAVLAALALAACSAPVHVAGSGASSPSSRQPAPAGSGSTGIAVAPAPSPGAGSTTTPGLAQLQAEYRSIVDRVVPSIVRIDTDQGLGSGIVMDANGDIVTNAHVIEGAQTISATTSDGVQHPATRVSSFTGNDLAVIHVAPADDVRPATFGDSAALHLGDIVLAIGSPLGLDESVSEGIVSGLGRSQPEGNGVTLTNLVQTTASINPGNSGGALVNILGQVVGIPTLGASTGTRGGGNAAGIGFAIPSNQVVNIAGQLTSGGSVTHTGIAYLGISSSDGHGGATVNSVVAGGPSDRAGIRAGWVITSIGGHAVPDSATISQVLAGLKPGDTVDVGARLPDGSSKTVKVTLGERPANP